MSFPSNTFSFAPSQFAIRADDTTNVLVCVYFFSSFYLVFSSQTSYMCGILWSRALRAGVYMQNQKCSSAQMFVRFVCIAMRDQFRFPYICNVGNNPDHEIPSLYIEEKPHPSLSRLMHSPRGASFGVIFCIYLIWLSLFSGDMRWWRAEYIYIYIETAYIQ